MNWPPPGSISAVTLRSGRRRESRSISHVAASRESSSVGHRAITTRPPLRCRRSTLAMIGAGSNTNNRVGQETIGSIAPFPVLHARCARRTLPVSEPPPLPLDETPRDLVVRLSMLGPRASFTDISGSTASSHNQQRHWSAAPTSSSRLTAARRTRAAVAACRNGSRREFASWKSSTNRCDLRELVQHGASRDKVSPDRRRRLIL